MVRFGFRVPSFGKRLSARTSLKPYVRNNLGLKAPQGWGWIMNPPMTHRQPRPEVTQTYDRGKGASHVTIHAQA